MPWYITVPAVPGGIAAAGYALLAWRISRNGPAVAAQLEAVRPAMYAEIEERKKAEVHA